MQHLCSSKRFWFFAMLLCIGLRESVAADKGIGVTLVNYTLQHTPDNEVTPGYVLSISARVKNFDTVRFDGILDFGLRNSRENLSAKSIFGRPNYSGQLIQLDPGEVVPAIFSVTIDPAYFIAPGPDVVVVWPISSEPVRDSIIIYLNVRDTTTGMKEGDDPGFGYATLKDRIQFFYPDNEPVSFKQVRIYDLYGRMISDYPHRIANEVPIPDLPRGIYLCEMITADGKIRTIKFIK